jgi:PAS domain S-box-containing protein
LLIANFTLPGNLTFSTITELQENVSIWGETWFRPIGEANPLRSLSEITTLLIIVFVTHASVSAFLSGERRKAIMVGGTILLFTVIAGIHTLLVDRGAINTPYMISWGFVAIAISLGNELVDQASKAAQLSRDVRESEIRWRTLLESAPLGIMGSDSDGVISYANRFVENMLGYSRDRMVGRKIVEFAPENLRSELDHRIKAAKVDELPALAEFPLLSNFGSARRIRWSIVRLHDNSDRVSGYIAICEDITELREAEDNLRYSERAIERYDRAAFFVEIASSLAHELNQPLSAILNNAQAGRRLLDQDGNSNEHLDEIFVDIANDDIRAGKVIDGMRRMLEQGEIKAVETDLSSLVAEVRRIVSGEFLGANIAVRINIPANIDRVYVGRTEIQQVLMNLFLNAVRIFREAGTTSPMVAIDARQVLDRVEITISDNGPGMDKATAERIFEPFYTTRKEGLGMGLSISRRIVELHGGQLKCDSDLGEGARFTFTVPAYESNIEAKSA